MSINKIISSTELYPTVNPLFGDCATVASALVELFDGDFVCLYDDGDTLPVHVLAEIDGCLYDGSGKVSKQEVFEIHFVMNGLASSDEDFDKYFVSEEPPEYMIDEEKKKFVKHEISLN